MLFTFDRYAPDYSVPATVTIGEISISLRTMTDDEIRPETMLARQRMTSHQHKVMLAAIALFENSAATHNFTLFHSFVYTAPTWYVDDVSQMVRTDTTIKLLGKVPAEGTYPGPVLNNHHGGHYTPKLNEQWAQQTADRLQDHGLLGN